MAVWWYFKNIRSCSIKDQTDAARSVEYGTDVYEGYWLGAHPLASHLNCRDITELFYSTNAQLKGISPSDCPVKRNDTLWVYDIFCLGSTNDKILSTLMSCHNAGIHLRIHTVQYHDIVREDGTNDYFLLSEVLKQLRRRHSPRKKQKRGRGKPARNIHYYNLSNHGKEVIAHYYEKDGTYTLKTALQAMQGTPKDGGPVGRDTFYKLLNEYKNLVVYRNSGKQQH